MVSGLSESRAENGREARCGPFGPVRVATALAAVLLAAALLVGCGGSGGVPVEEWRAEAEEVCAQAQVEAEALRPATGYTTAAGPLRAAATKARTQAAQTEELGTPQGLADESVDYVEALEAQAAALDQLAEKVLDDPTAAGSQAGAAVTVANRRVDEAAVALGIPGCTTAAQSDGSGATPEEGPLTDPGLGDGGTQEE